MLEVDLGPGVRAGFTTRHGGASPAPWASLNLGLGVGDEPARVRANRQLVSGWLGAPVRLATQVHGTTVLTIGPSGREDAGSSSVGPDSVGTADVLVASARSAGREAAVGVLVADCVPVLLADPVGQVVASAHAGRRGLADGVVAAALRAMVDAGARADRVRAVVGPCACARCYEVPATMRDDVATSRPTTWSTTSWGTAALDLAAGVESDLVACGVLDVRRVASCTIEDERFFSHRRATRVGQRTGRFAGVVALTA
ncbi:laccase domain-containing protein [Cellulosimicrobium terreum]|nr:laccase domain-containing protein [Cellulosimicrobium terreum]